MAQKYLINISTIFNIMSNKTYNSIFVQLDYNVLALNVNKDGFTFDSLEFNDDMLLDAFIINKGHKALKILGSILKNIEKSLNVVYVDKKNTIHVGFFSSYYEVELDDFAYDEIKSLKNVIIKEKNEIIRYYKEYFLRLYDRSRTA